MSIRLNVVVVQSPQMTSLQVGIVAEIVIQLLGRPGVDLAMVTTLEPDESESTDTLMLTGLESDLAVIDWRAPEESLASLSRLGIKVVRARHALDLEATVPAPGSRKLYAVDLRSGYKAAEVVQSVLDLLAARQVVTVSLGSKSSGIASTGSCSVSSDALKPAVAPSTMVATVTTVSEMAVASARVKPPEIAGPAGSAISPNRSALQTLASVEPASDQDEADEEALNDLVDRLNDIDL